MSTVAQLPERAGPDRSLAVGPSLRAELVAPRGTLPTFALAELREFVQRGENDSAACEQVLAQACRTASAIDLAIGDGLAALTRGDRLIRLGFSNLGDYAENILGMNRRTAQAAAQLARALETRPLLRAALHEGAVRPRQALAVLPVAKGEDEAGWVERAKEETVRALEKAVRRAKAERSALPGPDAAEEQAAEDEAPPVLFQVHIGGEERAALDQALELAERILEDPSRARQLEVMAEEYVAAYPEEAGEPGELRRTEAFRFPRETAERLRQSQQSQHTQQFQHPQQPQQPDLTAEVQAELDTDAWAYLEQPFPVEAPELGVDDLASAEDIDACLAGLANERASWDDLVGYCAHAVKSTGLHRVEGFASWRQYTRERLGMAPRTVEQRAALERRMWQVPALAGAHGAGLGYEKLRILSTLPDPKVAEWVAKAGKLTVVELRRGVAGCLEAQMCASGVFRAWLPPRVAQVLQMAMKAARGEESGPVGDDVLLARVCRHFTATWNGEVKAPRTASQKVRARDERHCRVPGCSRKAVHSHHLIPRSQGGSDDPSNLAALCGYHHLHGIHGGYIKVSGLAPDALEWVVGGVRWVDAAFGRRGPASAGSRGAG